MALYRGAKQKIVVKPIEIKDWIIKYNSIHSLTIEIILNCNVEQILESGKTIKYEIHNNIGIPITSFIHTYDNSDYENYSFKTKTIAINNTKTSYTADLTDTKYLDRNFFYNGNTTPININNGDIDVFLYMYIKNTEDDDITYSEIAKSSDNRTIKSIENINITQSNTISNYGNGNTLNSHNDKNNPTIYDGQMVYLTKGIFIASSDKLIFKTQDNKESIEQNITTFDNNYITPINLLDYCKIEIDLKYLVNGTLQELLFQMNHYKTPVNTPITYMNFVPSGTLPQNTYIFSKTIDFNTIKSSLETVFTRSGLLNDYSFSASNIITDINNKSIKITLTAKTKGIKYIHILGMAEDSSIPYINHKFYFNRGGISKITKIAIYFSNPYQEPLRIKNYDFINTQQIIYDANPQIRNFLEFMHIYDKTTKNLKTYKIDVYLKKNSTFFTLSDKVKISNPTTTIGGLYSSLSTDFSTNLSRTNITTKNLIVNIPFFKMFDGIKITNIYLNKIENNLSSSFDDIALPQFTITTNEPTFINGDADLTMTFTPTPSANTLTLNVSHHVCVNITFSNDMFLSFGATRPNTSEITYTIVA